MAGSRKSLSLNPARDKQELQATLFQSGLSYNTLQRFMCLNQNEDLAQMVFSALFDVAPGDDLIEVQSGRGARI
jgi:hypothetical protein